MPFRIVREFVLSVSCLFLLCVSVCVSAASKPAPLAIGSDLPDFNLPAVDGKSYTPASFKDAEVLMLVFTCNHCPTAQAYEGRLKEIAADYKDRVAVLAINPNHAEAVRLDEMAYTDLGDTFDEMVVRAEHQNFNFVYADDGPKQELTTIFSPIATPHVFIFDKKRKLRFQGRIDNSERLDLVGRHDTREALDSILAGKKPEIETTKVFGCSIKWADKVEDNIRWQKKVAKEAVTLEKADAKTLQALRKNADSGKLRLINAWATWCGPCVSEFDDLVETNLRFRIRDFELVTVAAQFPNEEAKVRKFLEKKRASSKNYIFAGDDKYKLLEALDPNWNGALPYTILVDEKGEVIYSENGPVDFLALRRVIVPALDKIEPWGGLGDN